MDKATWIEREKSYHIEESIVNSLEVAEVEDEAATATVDVTFEDDSGTPRFLITWSLVRGDDGKWKLNKELFTLRLN